jgi:hypothetical protein
MLSNITGFEWPLDQTIHVIYATGDNHIHEMTCGPDEVWRDADITRVAGGPELETPILAAYAWPNGQTQQVAYVSRMSNGHVHELVMREGYPWNYVDLMAQPTGASAADGMTLVGYSWKAGGTQQVVYTGIDAHVHELEAGVVGLWRHTDVTGVTDAPLAEGGALAGYAWEGQKTKHIVYVSGDGHVHELVRGVQGPWRHTDLTQRPGVPLAEGAALAGYAWETGGTQQIVYTGNNGNLYELVADLDNRWRYTDLTQVTSAPLVSGSALRGYAWETGGIKQVIYVGSDHHVHELMMDASGSWKHTDLTNLIGVPDAGDDVILGYEWTAQFAKCVFYLDTQENPHIHMLMLRHSSSWRHADLTELTGAREIV